MIAFRLPRKNLALWLAPLFVAYSALLIWNNFQAQQRIRTSALEELRSQSDRRAAALSAFLSERAEDVLDLAHSTTLQSYFLNRNLGMSARYGLDANLMAIEIAFRQFMMRKTQDMIYLYEGMALLDRDRSVLAAAGKNVDYDITAGAFMTPDQPEARLYLDTRARQVILSTEIFTNDDLEGHLVAVMPADRLEKHVRMVQGQGPIRFALVGRDGRPRLAAADMMATLESLSGKVSNLVRNVPLILEPEDGQGRRWVVLRNDIDSTGFALLTLAGEDYLVMQATPTVYLMGAALVPMVVLVAALILLRLRQRNQELADRFEESDRQRGELAHRTTNLEEEIRRRRAVEEELRRKGMELEQRSEELRSAMAEATHLALYDSLTGLSNRARFREELRLSIGRATREGRLLAVMFIDLDRFKRINDTLGHTAGDALLKEIAERVVRCIRDTDLMAWEPAKECDANADPWCVARQGGDEFTLLLGDLEDAMAAAHVAQRLTRAIIEPINVGGHEVVVTCSIGISLCPDDGRDADTLLKNADTAMYIAKENGRNQYRFFEPDMQANAMRRLELETDLGQALDRGQLSVHYQPIVHTGDGVVAGYEALLRWKHPTKGWIPPGEFIPLAEESGLIIPITNFVLGDAARLAADWHSRHGRTPRLAINLSGRILDLVDTVHMVTSALLHGPSGVEWLEVELTESTLMQRSEAVMGVLGRLRGMGVRVSIDDFGTGYSSLAYLKAFSIDTLKIDRSFVMDLPEDKDSGAIVRAILAMAHTLGLEVIAEGVENEEQYRFLSAFGCNLVQGYLTGKPMPVTRIDNPFLQPAPR